jgi:acyl carrier protein
MIPQHFFSIDKMPLTPAGKIDRKALPNMFSNVTAKTGSDTPKTDTQIHMAQIWKELLKVEKINLSDNFFDLGGHSLLIMELIAHIKSRFNVELSPRVFLQGTLEQIAASCGTHITPKSTIKHQLDTVAKESPKEGLIKSLFKSARKKF